MRYGYSFLLLLIMALVTGVSAELTVSYIDVGQGDSELLQSGGHNMLIDAGPSDAGPTVVNYLKSHGVSNLDIVVTTHPHEDHIGGMVDVLNAFPVSLYVDNSETTTTATYENVMSTLKSKQTPYAVVTTGKTIPFVDGITVNVLNPSALTGDLNEDSVVLKVTDGSEKFLFMGDASKYTGDPSAQVLKVTHHGSNSGSSPSFLAKVKPEVAVIEVGAGNSYDHPTQKTLTNLENAGAKIYQTDENGNIIIKSDGSSYTISAGKTGTTLTPSNQVIPKETQISIPMTKKATPVPTVAVSSSPSSSGTCDCSKNKYNCGDFPLSNGVTVQQCYDYCKMQGKGDIHQLDRDKDGLACEG
jgi:competence protein ComEC